MEMLGSIDLSDFIAELSGEYMLEPKVYLTEKQRNGREFCAEDVYAYRER